MAERKKGPNLSVGRGEKHRQKIVKTLDISHFVLGLSLGPESGERQHVSGGAVNKVE